MALDTYANLKTSIATWLARADLTNDVDDLIDQFEGWCNRNLRVPQMEGEATAQGAEYLALPADFMEMRDIQWQGSPRRQLDYVTPVYADMIYSSGASGIPHAYTIVGDQIRLIPAPSDTTNIRMSYWKKLEGLSGSNTSNWLLTLYPDAYLFGPLFYGKVRIQDVQMATAVADGWQGIMQELKRAGRSSNVGSLLQIRTA